jgi:predicted nucleic acid-binding protein
VVHTSPFGTAHHLSLLKAAVMCNKYCEPNLSFRDSTSFALLRLLKAAVMCNKYCGPKLSFRDSTSFALLRLLKAAVMYNKYCGTNLSFLQMPRHYQKYSI